MRAYILMMDKPGDLALAEDRETRSRILRGMSDGTGARNPVDKYKWAKAAKERKEPPQYLYAVGYGGPGHPVPYTTVRLENAKHWRTVNKALDAAERFHGTVLQVELADDPLRGDGEPVPKLVTGEAHRLQGGSTYTWTK